MQTFLPYPDFAESARVLDRARLGKQRIEVYQILRTLLGETQGWRNHPAVRMWRGYEYALVLYARAICDEWVARGYQDGTLEKIEMINRRYPLRLTPPAWLGDVAFHASHRAALLAKDPEHYGRFGWTEKPRIEYVWPDNEAAEPLDAVGEADKVCTPEAPCFRDGCRPCSTFPSGTGG